MQKIIIYMLSIYLLSIGSCKKDNQIISNGYIIAGENSNISTVIYSPVKQILSTKISIIENNVAKDTILSFYDHFDFDKDGSFDLKISLTARYPNKCSNAILLAQIVDERNFINCLCSVNISN